MSLVFLEDLHQVPKSPWWCHRDVIKVTLEVRQDLDRQVCQTSKLKTKRNDTNKCDGGNSFVEKLCKISSVRFVGFVIHFFCQETFFLELIRKLLISRQKRLLSNLYPHIKSKGCFTPLLTRCQEYNSVGELLNPDGLNPEHLNTVF